MTTIIIILSILLVLLLIGLIIKQSRQKTINIVKFLLKPRTIYGNDDILITYCLTLFMLAYEKESEDLRREGYWFIAIPLLNITIIKYNWNYRDAIFSIGLTQSLTETIHGSKVHKWLCELDVNKTIQDVGGYFDAKHRLVITNVNYRGE